MAEAVQEQDAQEEASSEGGGSKKLTIIIAGLVLLIAVVGIAVSMIGGGDEAEAGTAEAEPPSS